MNPSASAQPHLFGVRHLSPAASRHLRQLLDRVRPKLVLIEGSDDADDLIPHIVSPKSKLPIAILAYTADAPVRTFCYPLAIYSPEAKLLHTIELHSRPSNCAFGEVDYHTLFITERGSVYRTRLDVKGAY